MQDQNEQPIENRADVGKKSIFSRPRCLTLVGVALIVLAGLVIAAIKVGTLLRAEIAFGRSESYYRRGDMQNALRELDAVIALNPNRRQAYCVRGAIHHERSSYEMAIENYTQCLDTKHSDPGYYVNRGVAYYELGDYDSALADYEQAIQLDSDMPEAYMNRANTYKAMEDFDAAMADYELAIKLDPNDSQAYYNQALLYAELDDMQKALEGYSRAAELDPTNPEIYYNRAIIYDEEFGDQKAAYEDFGTFLSLYDRDDEYSRYARERFEFLKEQFLTDP